MNGTFARTLLTVVAVLSSLLIPTQARANTFEPWRFKTGTICLNDHGWKYWPTTAVVAAWDQSPDIRLVRSNGCAGYPRSQVIYLSTYNDPADNACAKTASSDNRYTWSYAYYADGSRKAVWVPDYMTIWMNMASNLHSRCRATPGQRAHVIAHEIGHALGVGHPSIPTNSVMHYWSLQSPTSWDIRNITTLY